MNDFIVEEGIPVQRSVLRAHSPFEPWRKYPFPDMKVGNSILDTEARTATKSKVCDAAHAWGKKNGCRFSGRAVEGGVRIWRTE